jgi:hypothetical protein
LKTASRNNAAVAKASSVACTRLRRLVSIAIREEFYTNVLLARPLPRDENAQGAFPACGNHLRIRRIWTCFCAKK